MPNLQRLSNPISRIDLLTPISADEAHDELFAAFMNTRLKSRAGWGLLTAYLIAAGFLFQEALTCSGWVCHLVAMPVVFPLGFPIAWLFERMDYLFVLPALTAGLPGKWHFILPTLLANAVFYFWAGCQLEKLLTRLHRRSKTKV